MCTLNIYINATLYKVHCIYPGVLKYALKQILYLSWVLLNQKSVER